MGQRKAPTPVPAGVVKPDPPPAPPPKRWTGQDAFKPGELWVHCGKCGHEWIGAYTPMDLDLFARLMKRSMCPKCAAGAKSVLMGRKAKPTAAGAGAAEQWLQNGDTGTSSKTIWSVMMGTTPERADIPYDPADFGRCYRLLKVMPEWTSRLGEVADKYPAWRPFVAAWQELTDLYERELPDGYAPLLYARMRALGGGIEG